MELTTGIILGIVAVLFWQTLIIEEKLNKILTELGLRKIKPKIKFIVKGNAHTIRGRQYPPSRYENEFWDRFPELLFDDPEDQHNHLIEKLRNTAIKYFKDLALSNTLTRIYEDSKKSKESKKVKQIKNLMDLYERGVITYWIYMEEIKKIVSTV